MTVLLLAGTAEARALAGRLAGAGFAAVASYAGAVEEIGALPVPHRVGGFGGAEEFRSYLIEAGIVAVIDATHPFAAAITRRTHAICDAEGVPYLRLQRPPWRAQQGDRWTEVARPEDVVKTVPRDARIFLSVGRKEIVRYRGLEGREVILRSIDPPGGLPGGWRSVRGKPPFTVEDEAALFALLGIDWLVTKNAGGAASAAKLQAARQMGLPVAMIARPPLPEGAAVAETVDAAMDWLKGLPA